MHVYAIQNTENGKLYIGKHSKDNLASYLTKNLTCALSGVVGKCKLYNAIRKYGRQSFTIRSIFSIDDANQLNLAERVFIKFFGSQNDELGYNITAGGDGTKDLRHSEETKEILRIKSTGVIRTDESRKRLSESLKLAYKEGRRSTEQIKKLALSMVGRTISEESKEKMRESGKKRAIRDRESLLKSAAKAREVMKAKRVEFPERYKRTPEHKAKLVASRLANRLKKLEAKNATDSC